MVLRDTVYESVWRDSDAACHSDDSTNVHVGWKAESHLGPEVFDSLTPAEALAACTALAEYHNQEHDRMDRECSKLKCTEVFRVQCPCHDVAGGVFMLWLNSTPNGRDGFRYSLTGQQKYAATFADFDTAQRFGQAACRAKVLPLSWRVHTSAELPS